MKQCKTSFTFIRCVEYLSKSVTCDLNLSLNRLRSIHDMQWKQTLELQSKRCTYPKLKDDYATEQYLNIFLTRYQRSLFRAGILPLRHETDHFNTIIDPATGSYRHLRLFECIYLFGVLHCFEHWPGHITMSSFVGRGNHRLQLVKVLYCKICI